jgi:dTDP-4-amino-4,6-dideoxygalactose transaminase
LLTTSCTDALELAALLLNISENDEIIAPSFTFVSTVNPFLLRGAKVNFVDSYADNPNMNVGLIEPLITPKTKAIIVVHYAGVACDMDAIMQLAKKYNLYVVEDAAQAIDSYYKNVPLGSIGQLAAFSFHETKNIISGEGGMLTINAGEFAARAEILREKGTNRSAFFRGEVDKYGWVDIGSSFLPSEIIAAFLFAQLENLQTIQHKRRQLWNIYNKELEVLKDANVALPVIPDYASNNAHMYYLVCNSLDERTRLIQHLKNSGVQAVFHYQSLHNSPYYSGRNKRLYLPNADKFSDCLVRLPLFYEMQPEDAMHICKSIKEFYKCDEKSISLVPIHLN